MSFSKTTFITISVLLLSLFVSNDAATELAGDDCVLTQEVACYYCDSEHNDHCGNPFEFSHFYVSREVYVIACYGCCIKIVYPMENGERRIIRSCVENHPHLNITLKDDCDSSDGNSRQVCLCSGTLCNAANQNAKFLLNTPTLMFLLFLIHLFVLC